MLKLGVSSCLAGTKCRYDGGHKRFGFLMDGLAKHAEIIQYCPEDRAFGTPRESIRLVRNGDRIDAVGNSSNREVTEVLLRQIMLLCESIAQDQLNGFILKSKSPSCGLERVKPYLPNGMPAAATSGLFAAMLTQRFPNLPVEDEGRLQDSWLKENFLMQLYAYHAIMQLQQHAKKIAELIDFHARYKYLLLSKSQKHYKQLGKVVANRDKCSFETMLKTYVILFLEAIKIKNSRGKTHNTLEHMIGYFKKELATPEKTLIQKSLREFREGVVPLIVPLKLIELYVEKYDITYLKQQVFLNPYPQELGLRSDIKAYK